MKRVSRLIVAGVFVCVFIMVIFAFVLIFGKMDETVEAYGSVLPLEYVDVSPEHSGIIKRIEILDGDIVEFGDTLILLCDEDLQFELEQAQMSLEQAQSRLVQAKEQYKNLDESESFETSAEFASLRRAREELKFRERVYNRSKELFEKGSLTYEELENAEHSLSIAATYLEALEERMEMLRNQLLRQIEEYKRRVEIEQKAYNLARKELEKCVITAPRNGTVMAPDIENMVGTMAVEGQSLLRICDLSQMGFLAGINENDIPKIETGQEVRLFINAFPHRKYGIIQGLSLIHI